MGGFSNKGLVFYCKSMDWGAGVLMKVGVFLSISVGRGVKKVKGQQPLLEESCLKIHQIKETVKNCM